MKQPMLMIDAERQIRLKNTSAAALLARRDLLVEQGGLLGCRDRESDRRFAISVRAMVASGHEPDAHERRAVWLKRADGRSAAAILHTLREEDGAERRATRILVAVFEHGEAARADPELVAAAYQLTGAEARLAAMIAEGHGTAYCAKALGVKTSTLRSHLSSIYRKTGANGKADLVRLVLSLCAI